MPLSASIPPPEEQRGLTVGVILERRGGERVQHKAAQQHVEGHHEGPGHDEPVPEATARIVKREGIACSAPCPCGRCPSHVDESAARWTHGSASHPKLGPEVLMDFRMRMTQLRMLNVSTMRGPSTVAAMGARHVLESVVQAVLMCCNHDLTRQIVTRCMEHPADLLLIGVSSSRTKGRCK